MMNNKGKLIVYSGPSGVGKGTILAPLLGKVENNLILSISATTRAPREGEIDGAHYHFVSKERFLKMIDAGEMLEYAQYNGNYYGTPKAFVEEKIAEGKQVILEIELQGARSIKETFPQALFIFVMPPSYGELVERLTNRNTETQEQLNGRLKTAVLEMKHAYEYDFIIVNDNLLSAREALLKAIQAGDYLTRFNTNIIEEVQI